MIYVIGLDGIVRGIISNDIPKGAKYWDDLHVRAVKDGLSVFEFKCSAGFEATGAIEVEHYVADATNDDQLVLFKVKEIQTIHGADGLYKQVFAESVSLELLKTVVRPNTFTGVSAEPILDYVLDGTPWQRGIVEVAGITSADFKDYPTAVETINKVAEEVGGEVAYRITLADGRISGRFVDIVERLGRHTGKRFEYGKDVLEIVKTEDNSEIFTAVVPIGSSDEGGDPVTVTNLSDTFTKPNGTIVYKNAGEDFIADPEALVRWSADGQHLTAVLKVEDFAPNTILRKGWEFLLRHNEPKLQYELSVALLAELVEGYGHESVQIGDTVTIVDHDFEEPLALEARIVEMGISKTNPANSYVKFANFVELDVQAEDRIADLMEKIRRNEAVWIKNTEGDTIYKSPTAPSNPTENMLWLDTSGTPEILKRYDGTIWKDASPTSAAQIGAETPGGAQQKADDAQAAAESYADTLKSAIDADVSAVASDLTSFETTVNTTFKDGIIEEAEAVAVEKYKNTLNAEKIALDQRYNVIYVIPELTGTPKTNLASAKTAYNTAHANLIAAVDAAIADGITTPAEKANVDSKFGLYRTALSTLQQRLEQAVDAVAAVKAGNAEQAAKDYADTQDGTVLTSANGFTQSYAQKNITQDTTPPIAPGFNDLWIDISDTPHVWKRWNGSNWITAVPTELAELAGQVTETQIADDSIRTQHIAVNTLTSAMVVTSGLDAAVIKFGTMSGASVLLGGLNDENGVLIVHSSDGEPIAELNGDEGGFPYLSVGYLNAPNKVEYGDFSQSPLTFHVAPEQFSTYAPPSDENGGTGWNDSLRTIQEAVNRIPKVFDGEVLIYLAYGQTFYEDVTISGFSGSGTIKFDRSAETTRPKLQGSVTITNNSVRVEWRNINLDTTDDYAGFFIQNTCGTISNVSINGVSGNTQFGVNVNTGGSYEFYSVYVANVQTGFRASYGGFAFVNNCTGSGSIYGMQGFAGTIMGGGTAPTGSTANSASAFGGQVTGSWTYPAPPVPPSPVTETVITKWTANSDSGTWRTDYAAWDIYASANQVTQGSYAGNGDFKGSWFFGTGVASTLSGKTIRRIRIFMRREAGGVSASVSARIRPHTSSSRPSGNVSIQSPSHNAGFYVGEGKWVTLPTSFHAGFASGSYKGLSIDGTAYMKFAKSAVLEVTYET